ncbi:histidinol-phosphatase [Thalassobacillus devorans]|uniref:Histidinol-phosphatase n=1 Tax=Thalassobacillus devorans TaxID=279813 RepID=A0ABQ1PAP1_9BACI|nr:histidinol-phosphatase HisJ [Thalassobacillus devorans]NIK29922.1 histidinol-phosphatase (PHP family) [Thalassobacillus devorans]GGC93900.1 histidinol-phosphatase [Thalassobacillus devorans]
MKIDGHIHTPYCPHGTSDPFKAYVEEALKQGYSSMSFTEHAPLPPSFLDPVPDKDSGMDLRLLERYIQDIEQIKKEYQKDIDILIGLEVDYIDGYEQETTEFLTRYGSRLDDSILSVHFLKGPDHYHCIDFSEAAFQHAIDDFGSLEKVYQAYFRTLEKSIQADLGPFKPGRIGHMTLVRKFHHHFPSPADWDAPISALLEKVKQGRYQLDYNAAGYFKPACLESYPPQRIARQAYQAGIELIYGSDAHKSTGIGQGFDRIDHTLTTG